MCYELHWIHNILLHWSFVQQERGQNRIVFSMLESGGLHLNEQHWWTHSWLALMREMEYGKYGHLIPWPQCNDKGQADGLDKKFSVFCNSVFCNSDNSKRVMNIWDPLPANRVKVNFHILIIQYSHTTTDLCNVLCQNSPFPTLSPTLYLPTRILSALTLQKRGTQRRTSL